MTIQNTAIKWIITISVLLSGDIGSYAQNISAEQIADPDAAMNAKMGASIAVLHLDTLAGAIPALYNKNYGLRAGAIQSAVEKCAGFYKPEFPDIKFNLQIMVLDQQDWDRIQLEEYGSPYGMPTAWPVISKLFIAADKQAVGKLFGETDNLPDTVLSAFDCIALHELGHIFLKGFNHTNTQKKWADEFLASYFAICFFKENKNYPGLPQVGESGYRPAYKTLEDFERLYSNVGARNYGWYQGRFQELGNLLYPKFKTGLIRKFIDNYAAGGRKLPPLILLKQLAPEETSQWLKEME
jgi:hypothetical protein